MDKRWKAVERGAAEELNHVLSGVGDFTLVERIPILGREGPDLTINESGLVINVKSRKNIPDRLFPKPFGLLQIGDLFCFHLQTLYTASQFEVTQILRPWKQLQDWYDRMDDWTKEFRPDGISAIFLHRPKMPYGSMGVVIHYENLRRLSCNLKKTQSN